MSIIALSPIGTISSCYKEKFGIPRQPNLVPSTITQLILNKEFGEESIRGLEDFSHIWLSFIFHDTQKYGWKPMVRPPRLGGNTKVGVFASRSTFRPNPLGLSVVKLLKIDVSKGFVILHLGGSDLLDKTPILDIKPYLPYVDSIPNASGGFAEHRPSIIYTVSFTETAKLDCKKAIKRLELPHSPLQNIKKQGGCALKSQIKQILELDPRPSYQKGEKSDRIYAMKLYDFDLKWQYCENNKIRVIALDN